MNLIPSNSQKFKVAGAFGILYLVWGSTYLALLLAVRSIPPFILSGFRFLLAGSLLLLISWNKGRLSLKGMNLGRNVLYGSLLLFGGTVSVAWSEQYIPSSLAAIIVTALPFWMVLLDRKQWSWYFSHWSIPAGILVGFLGVILLLGLDHRVGPTNPREWAGALAVVAGGICWATGSLLSKYRPAGQSVMLNASVQLLAASLLSLLAGIGSGEWSQLHWMAVSTRSWLALGYLVIMGSIVAYMSYLWLLKVKPAAQVSTYVYVNPIVALLLGGWLAGENISLLQCCSLLIILAGVLLVNLPSYLTASKAK